MASIKDSNTGVLCWVNDMDTQVLLPCEIQQHDADVRHAPLLMKQNEALFWLHLISW